MILIFLGPPGAGKGTQAKIIEERFGVPSLTARDTKAYDMIGAFDFNQPPREVNMLSATTSGSPYPPPVVR